MAQSSPFDTFRSRSLIGGWLLLVFPVLVVSLASYREPRGQAAQMAAGYLAYGVMALWAIFMMRHHRVSWRFLLGHGDWRTHGRLVLLAIPLMAFALGGIWLIYYPLSFINPDLVTSLLSVGEEDNLAGQWARDALVFGQVAIVAPIVEEVVFRGLLLHRWARKWGNRKALFWTSILFGVLHVDLLGGFVFGYALGLLYVVTRSLALPMAVHILHNGLALVLQASLLHFGVDTEFKLEEFHRDWWLGPVCLFFGTIGLWYVARRYWPEPGWRMPYEWSSLAAGGGEP